MRAQPLAAIVPGQVGNEQHNLDYQSLMAELAEAKEAAKVCAWLCTLGNFVVVVHVHSGVTLHHMSVGGSDRSFGAWTDFRSPR